ncbi:hypothetical protein SAMD00019534_048770, partial [Acytostelium subglobosum LB1]|uniref:hypothetical protein n=1 Tax=Acytostelium subglobosum LB1 TaxID=1410327 RepID=UPI000644929C
SEMKPIIVIHGGAGTITRDKLTIEMEEQYRSILQTVLESARTILEGGGSALDAVEEAVRLMEESPLFNAGRGSVMTADGTYEMDASIMDGSTLKAGAVGGVQRIRNPILAARTVMDRTRHVMLIGEGAERFAKSNSDRIELVDPSFFFTERRMNELKRAQSKSEVVLDHDGANKIAEDKQQQQVAVEPLDPDRKFGTVGAVALDVHGNLASATSTGGMTNKMPGRVGDSPVIGAGCYANNKTVAVSTTGVGESFMRTVAAFDLSALMDYANKSVEEAGKIVVFERLPSVDGSGGLIAVDKQGNFTMPFNTEGMYRGYARAKEEAHVYIYK